MDRDIVFSIEYKGAFKLIRNNNVQERIQELKSL